jgi:hypothetical protein
MGFEIMIRKLSTVEFKRVPLIEHLTREYLASNSDPSIVDHQSSFVEPHDGVFFHTSSSVHQYWQDTLSVFHFFDAEPIELPLPPSFLSCINTLDSLSCVSLCAGSFPQRLNNSTSLLSLFDSGQLRSIHFPKTSDSLAAFSEHCFSLQSFHLSLILSGIAATYGLWDTAETALETAKALKTDSQTPAWAHQEATLLWMKDTKSRPWTDLSHPASHFNLGLANLMDCNYAASCHHFDLFLQTAPPKSPWIPLAHLYHSAATSQK